MYVNFVDETRENERFSWPRKFVECERVRVDKRAKGSFRIRLLTRISQISDISKLKSEGYSFGKPEFICKDIGKLELKVDVVIQNPPFGTKVKHNDIFFLENALKIAPIVYSFHKSETKGFLHLFSAKKNAKITHIWDFKFPLKATFSFHRRQIHRINVSCLRFEKK